MEIRILVAVFLTLSAVAMGMADGEIRDDEIKNLLNNLDTPEDVVNGKDTSFLDNLGLFEEPDRPANSTIQARLESPSPVDLDLSSPADLTLRLTDGTTMTVGDATLSPSTGDTPVTVSGFTGTVSINDEITFDGTARSVQTAAITMNYSSGTTISIGEGQVAAVNISHVEGQHLTFHTATGEISTNSAPVYPANESVDIRYFDGQVDISRTNTRFRYDIDGAMFETQLPGITIGG